MTSGPEPPERDELDRRVEEALRALTEPAGEPLAMPWLQTAPGTRGPRGLGLRATTAATAAIALAVGIVFALQAVRGTPSGSPSASVSAASASGIPSSDEPGPPSPAGDGIERLRADLERGGANVDELGTFDLDPMPFDARGVRLCVDGQQVDVYVYRTEQERTADAALIDPDDPSHIGPAIVSWQGQPTFWERDRVIVFYQGSDKALARQLTSLLGPPLARKNVGVVDTAC